MDENAQRKTAPQLLLAGNSLSALTTHFQQDEQLSNSRMQNMFQLKIKILRHETLFRCLLPPFCGSAVDYWLGTSINCFIRLLYLLYFTCIKQLSLHYSRAQCLAARAKSYSISSTFTYWTAITCRFSQFLYSPKIVNINWLFAKSNLFLLAQLCRYDHVHAYKSIK